MIEDKDEQKICSMVLQLGLLAKMHGETQESLSEKCGLSRATVNRYFRGKNEIKAKDFVGLLACLGVDVTHHIQKQVSNFYANDEPENEHIYDDLISILRGMDFSVKKSLIEQILWWSRNSESQDVKQAQKRIQSHLISKVNYT